MYIISAGITITRTFLLSLIGKQNIFYHGYQRIQTFGVLRKCRAQNQTVINVVMFFIFGKKREENAVKPHFCPSTSVLLQLYAVSCLCTHLYVYCTILLTRTHINWDSVETMTTTLVSIKYINRCCNQVRMINVKKRGSLSTHTSIQENKITPKVGDWSHF